MKKIFTLTIALLVIDRLLKAVSYHAIQGILFPQHFAGVNMALGFNLHPIQTAIFPYDWLVAPIIYLSALLVLSYGVPDSRALQLPIAIYIIGAVSNAADRVWLGMVINPLGLAWPNGWLLFNLADILVPVGLGSFILAFLLAFDWKSAIPNRKTVFQELRRFYP